MTKMTNKDNSALRYRKMRQRVKHVHPMIANTAVEIVMASYEALMSHNEHYAVFKSGVETKLGHTPNSKELEQAYLEYNWGKGVDAARTTLAQLLAPGAASALDDVTKSSIHEALVLDHSLKMGRGGKDAVAAQRREFH